MAFGGPGRGLREPQARCVLGTATGGVLIGLGNLPTEMSRWLLRDGQFVVDRGIFKTFRWEHVLSDTVSRMMIESLWFRSWPRVFPMLFGTISALRVAWSHMADAELLQSILDFARLAIRIQKIAW